MLIFLETLAVALVGGVLFSIINLPLPWLLGSLMFVMVWNTGVKRAVFWPIELRNTGLMILGYMMGTSFNGDTVAEISSQLPTMVIVNLISIIFCILIAYISHKVMGISLHSSIMGSVPGGLTQMIVLSEEVPGTDITIVTFMQTFRVITTVFAVPFLVIHGFSQGPMPAIAPGEAVLVTDPITVSYWVPLLFLVNVIFVAWLAQKIHLPTPFLLGPLLGTAVLVLIGVPSFTTPNFLIVISQLCMGAYLGTNVKLASMNNWKKILPYTLMSCIALIMFSLGVGVLLSYMHHVPLIDSFLCTAPGGMAEMGLTALMVKGNVSLVSAYQLFRVIFILLFVPLLIKRWIKYESVHLSQS